jgi:hypothetical protein
MVGKGADGQATEWGDNRRSCDASLGRCCASPQVIVKEPVQNRPHGGEITPAITREPPTPDQRVDFGLAQLDPEAAQPFLAPVPVAAHPLGTGRARPDWRSRERRVGHDLPILHRGSGKKEPRRDGRQQPEPGQALPPARHWEQSGAAAPARDSRALWGRSSCSRRFLLRRH